MSAEPLPAEPLIAAAEYCVICGIDLENQRDPDAARVIWPEPLLDGETPRANEICDTCSAWEWIK